MGQLEGKNGKEKENRGFQFSVLFEWIVVGIFLLIFFWTDGEALEKDLVNYSHSFKTIKHFPESSHSLSSASLASLKRDSLNALYHSFLWFQDQFMSFSIHDEESFQLVVQFALFVFGLFGLFLLSLVPEIVERISLHIQKKRVPKDEMLYQSKSGGITVENSGNNRVVSTLLRAPSIVLIPLGLISGVVTYMANFDSIVFTSIGLLQYYLLGQKKSIVPLMIFAIPFAINGAVSQFQLRRRDDSINNQSATRISPLQVSFLRHDLKRISKALIQERAHKTKRQELKRGDLILVKSGGILPADCAVLSAFVSSETKKKTNWKDIALNLNDSSDWNVFTDEKGLTGEDRTQPKKFLQFGNSNSLRIPVTGDSFYLEEEGSKPEVKDASFVCFQDTRVFIDKIPEGSSGYLLLMVLRIGSETKASRKDSSLIEPYSSNLQRFIRRAMLATISILLSTVIFDTILVRYYCSIYENHPANEISLGRLFVLQMLYQNMMVPMSLRQALMTVCLWRKSSFNPLQCNDWTKQEVLNDVKIICTDKTGTLTQNKMSLIGVGMWNSKDNLLIRSSLASSSQPLNPMWDLSLISSSEENFLDVKGDRVSREEKDKIERRLFTCYATTSDESVSGPKKQPEEAAFLLGVPIKLVRNDKFEPGTREKRVLETNSKAKKTNEIVYKKGFVSYQSIDNPADVEEMEVSLSMGLNKILLVKSEVIKLNDSLRKQLELENDPEAHFVVFCQSSEEFLVNGQCNPKNKRRIDRWISCVSEMSKAQGAPRVWFHSFKTLPASAQSLLNEYNRVSEIEDEEQRIREQTNVAKQIFSLGEHPLVQSASYLVDEYQNRVEEGVMELRENGITMAMITGDSSRAAQEIAQAIGMPQSVIVEAESCEELHQFIENVLKQRKEVDFEEPKTFIFDRKHTEFIREAMDTVEDSRGTWSFVKRRVFGESSSKSLPLHQNLLLALYTLFHLSDPDTGFKLHHSVWARSLPFQKPQVVKFFEKTCGMPSLFAGDGINDLMAIERASVSVGIRGTETPVVARTASFATDEWFPIVNMVLTKGPETSAMLTTTVKIIWVKHALTSWSLEALAVLHSFDSFIEPYASQLMMAYNAATFFNIIAHVVSDVLEPEQARNLRSKNMYSVRSWFRWLFVGAVFGIITTVALELVFPEVYGGLFDEDVTQPSQSFGSELSREQFGYRMASIHSMLLTTILIFATNQWQRTSASSVFKVIRHKLSETLHEIFSFFKSINEKTKKKNKLRLSAEETVVHIKETIESDSRILLHYTHTPIGRLLITLIFIRLLTIYGGIGIISTLMLSAGICLLCCLFMVLVIHRNSPARFVLHPISSVQRIQRRYFPSMVSPRNSPRGSPLPLNKIVQNKKIE